MTLQPGFYGLVSRKETSIASPAVQQQSKREREHTPTCIKIVEGFRQWLCRFEPLLHTSPTVRHPQTRRGVPVAVSREPAQPQLRRANNTTKYVFRRRLISPNLVGDPPPRAAQRKPALAPFWKRAPVHECRVSDQ